MHKKHEWLVEKCEVDELEDTLSQLEEHLYDIFQIVPYYLTGGNDKNGFGIDVTYAVIAKKRKE